VHIITKILVVFAAVLSILLAALSVAYSTNAREIKGTYQDLALEIQALRQELNQERTDFQSQLSERETRIDALRDQLSDLRGEKEALERDNSKLLARVKAAETQATSIQSKVDQLAATNQTQANLIEVMYSEVSGLRESELRSTQTEIELADRVSDIAAQLEVAREMNRALQEQLADLQASGSAVASRREVDSFAATRPIKATVTNIRRDTSGQLLAAIDAGSADRIRPGMELSVTRGNEFIAKLRVLDVDLNNASGVVDTLNRNTQVQVGDVVYSTIR